MRAFTKYLAPALLGAGLAGLMSGALAQDFGQAEVILAQGSPSQSELDQAIEALSTLEPGSDNAGFGIIEGMIARGIEIPCRYQQGEYSCTAGMRKGITAYSFKINGGFQVMIDQQGPSAGYVVHYDAKGCVVRKYPMGSRIELKPNCDAELVSGGQRYQLGPLCDMKPDPAPPTCRN
jgi:hypothetical protein